jgi:asparagine synthase (glutamine-hydrolysing)
MLSTLERVVDLIDPAANALEGATPEEARAALLSGDPARVRALRGSFALVVKEGTAVRMARSLDRPLRYFLAKRAEGPALFVASRIDVLYHALQKEGLEEQFHPSYTRMVPAHHLTELQLIGCPDPSPVHVRFFDPERNSPTTDLGEIGRRYIGALTDEVASWLKSLPEREPVGVSFSGGIDSGAVFLATTTAMQRLGMNLSRLKAFTLTFGDGEDLQQAREFLRQLDLELFLEPIEADPASIDMDEAIRVVEDYKPLDVESAAMAMALFRGVRARYPKWVHVVDGDGGDENLKDYPVEENPELTIRSVVSNPMLYQEGWGVGKIKHSLTYSGGLSRAATRSFAPARHFGFLGFSPFTRPDVIAVAEAIPFDALTKGSLERLYALKGEIVAAGVKAVTGLAMPAYPKRRFQHGATALATLRAHLPERESDYRRRFLSLYDR